MEETQGADGKPGVTLTPAWLSRDMWQADSAVVANGGVFVYGNGEDAPQSTADIGLSYNTAANRIKHSSHATLYALDAKTGAELWSSGDQITSFNHFTSLSIANGARLHRHLRRHVWYSLFGVDKPRGHAVGEIQHHDANDHDAKDARN